MRVSSHARRPGTWPARYRAAGPGGRAATAAVAVAIAAGGCAAVPTSGAVQQFGGAVPNGVNPQDYSQAFVRGPGPGWTAKQIVEGFVAANASFAGNHEVAKEYLDPTARLTWNPRWAVDVVSSSLQVSSPTSLPRRAGGGPGDDVVSVRVTGLRVGTLTAAGLPLASPGSAKQTVTFTLESLGGQWRIINPPQTLLLTQSAFQRVYQPRNVYFLAGSGRTLVPDAVFVPEPDTNTQLAFGLATALLQNPGGWLDGAAVTGFPAKSTLIGVKINGPNAIVDLGGKAAAASRLQQEQMAAQLAWTFASGPPSIQAVELEINGRPLPIRGNPLQLLNAYSNWMPGPSAGSSSLYYIGSGGSVKVLSGVGPPGSGQLGSANPVPGRLPPLGSIAVSPDGRWIAGISATGTAVYAWDLAHKAAPVREWSSSPGPYTSLSWDQQGDLWITAGGGVWLLPPGKDSATPVLASANTVASFQVAPDGVRAVMILSSGAPLQLVAISRSGGPSLGQPIPIGSGIADPESLSWYDANNVIVLDGSSSGGQLYEVPLNGGPLTAIPSQPNIVSVTATNPSGPSTNIAVGLAGGQIMISSKLGAAFEITRATGQAPAFPG